MGQADNLTARKKQWSGGNVEVVGDGLVGGNQVAGSREQGTGNREQGTGNRKNFMRK